MRNKNSERYRNETPEQLAHRREVNRKSYLTHKDKYARLAKEDKVKQNEHKIRFARENPEKYLYSCAKKRAKDAGLEFSIKLEDITIPDKCPILGIKLTKVKCRETLATSPSVDRVDNTKGYTSGNVRVISYRANAHKGNMSFDDIERLLLYSKGLI